MTTFNITGGEGNSLPPVSYDDALKRVVAYVSASGSGWVTYDLPAVHARRAGQFRGVEPWSLLLANALSGRVDQSNIAGFTLAQRKKFAERVSRVPDGVALADLSDDEVDAVVDLASFGFSGVWGAKTTKLAALYRPMAVPVLDAQMARAFGMGGGAFRTGKEWTVNIGRVTRDIAAWLRVAENSELLACLRADVAKTVPDIELLSDVRLLDIVLWTSQDDLFTKRKGKKKRWADIEPGESLGLDDVASVPIPG